MSSFKCFCVVRYSFPLLCVYLALFEYIVFYVSLFLIILVVFGIVSLLLNQKRMAGNIVSKMTYFVLSWT